MNKKRVAIVGATGMVGQRLLTLLEDHPYFDVSVLAASRSSAGKKYYDALAGRWKLPLQCPAYAKEAAVVDAGDISYIKSNADIVFCAVNMPKNEIKALEQAYAEADLPVISNNSANRTVPDIPMIIPEINPQHLSVIETQKKRLGTKRGFIVTKPNCSIQSYVPALTPLLDFGIKAVSVTTMQAISGAGRTFETFPEITDNVIPYINGEEEKSENEPLKIWGKVVDGKIVSADEPIISAQCIRVPVSDGHLASVFVSFNNKPTADEILRRWQNFSSIPQQLRLPHAPDRFVSYIDEPDRPQTRLDRDVYGGMGITVGRLRPDNIFDYKFVCLSHNTLRGAAGGGVLTAELLYKLGYLD